MKLYAKYIKIPVKFKETFIFHYKTNFFSDNNHGYIKIIQKVGI